MGEFMQVRAKKILLVDDEAMNSMILTRRLRKQGFIVETASNGQEAVDYMEQNPKPDVILMDLMMPVMDGWQSSEIIKEKFPDLGIIAVSAKTDEDVSANKFDEFCSKPVNFDVLLKQIEKFI